MGRVKKSNYVVPIGMVIVLGTLIGVVVKTEYNHEITLKNIIPSETKTEVKADVKYQLSDPVFDEKQDDVIVIDSDKQKSGTLENLIDLLDEQTE